MRGVKIDLSSPPVRRSKRFRLKQAMAANGNGVNRSARYDGKNEAQPARDRAGSPWKCRTSVLDDDFLSSGDHQQLTGSRQLLQGLSARRRDRARDRKRGLPIFRKP